MNFTLKFSFLKRQAKLANLEIVAESEKNPRSGIEEWRGGGGEKVSALTEHVSAVSLSTLGTVIFICVTLVCLLTVAAYKVWKAKHTNTYWVN